MTLPAHNLSEALNFTGGDYAEVVFNKIIYSYNKDDINLYAAYDSSRYINIDLIEKGKSLGVILIDIKEVKPTEILQKYKIDRFYSPSFNQLENNSIKSTEFSKIKEKINIREKKYFLVTNAERWIKNAIRAVQAFDLILDDKKFCDYKLVLTGVINKKIFEKEIKHKENFVLLNYIERDELKCLFENSYAFIYPSLNEGFGYPPLSAMKYGVPVIASGSSSIPEVCGNAAIYFDPYSIYEIKNRILQLSDKEIYNECSKNGLERFAYISEIQKKDLQRLSQIILQ